MSVNSKMTAIADPIRTLMGKTGKLGLDAMASNLHDATEEVDLQYDLIQQILEALQGKAAGGSESTVDTTAALDSAILDQMILE